MSVRNFTKQILYAAAALGFHSSDPCLIRTFGLLWLFLTGQNGGIAGSYELNKFFARNCFSG